SPGCLYDRPAGYHPGPRTQFVGREVVEHDRVDARGDALLDLVEAIDPDLEMHGVAEACSRPANRLADRHPGGGEHGEVVVFRHHGIREREAVVAPAAVAYGLTFEDAQPGGGLAGVDDAYRGAVDRRDVARGQCRDAAHALHEIEGDALGAQHGVGRAVDARQHRPG